MAGGAPLRCAPAPFLHMNENAIQRAVFQHLRTRGASGLLALHPKNASSDMRGRRRGIHVGLGVEPGASDVLIFHAGKFYALELKVEGKEPTDRQHEFLRRFEIAGGAGAWVAGLDSALRQLEQWGLLRGKAA